MNEGSASTHGSVNPESAPVRGSVDYHSLIGEARIHGSLYTSEQVFDDEMDRIFRRGWVFVGHESEVPTPGDYVTRVLGRESVMMLRNKQKQIKVFSNRCTHRGNKLCPKQQGNARALTCDYHGWTFSLDGDLAGVPYPGGFTRRKEDLALRGPARVDSYQGFVFASFNAQVCSLEAHLGEARALIDRLVRLSPVGRIRLDAGWVKQQFQANWKMLPESDTDGYHANFVHSSFLRVFRSQYDALRNREEDRRSVVRDWGSGHVAIDAAPMYRQPLEWLGTTEDRVPEYVASMTEAYGAADTRRMLTEGPPHSVIFPNLFLGEMNVVIFQPMSAGRSVQWHTPLLLEGAPDSFNARIIRQSEASMGPSAFLLADDAVISERQQIALQGESAWLDLSRGLNREYRDGRALTSHISDETTNRGFWRHYLRVMAGA